MSKDERKTAEEFADAMKGAFPDMMNSFLGAMTQSNPNGNQHSSAKPTLAVSNNDNSNSNSNKNNSNNDSNSNGNDNSNKSNSNSDSNSNQVQNDNVNQSTFTFVTKTKHLQAKLAILITKASEYNFGYERTKGLSVLIECQSVAQEIEKEKIKILNEVSSHLNKMTRDLYKFENNLCKQGAMESFESKWIEWDINETVKWFDFVLKYKSHKNKNRHCNKDGDNDNDYDSDYDIEDYSSSSSDDSGADGDPTNDNVGEDEKQCEITKEIDYNVIKSRLNAIKFRAKKNLPFLLKPYHFAQFGFENKNDCKILCKETKTLIAKYPKKKLSKKNAKRSKNNKKPIPGNYDLEGFVQDTH